MTESAVAILQALGYVGMAALLALDECFPPLPADLLLPFVGFLAASGQMSLPIVLLAATGGSIAGQLIVYLVARWGGPTLMQHLSGHLDTVLPSYDNDVRRAQAWFKRYGGAAIFFARLLPLGSLIAIPAGLARMPVRRFVLYSAAGIALWNSTLIGLGWSLGEEWARVAQFQFLIELAGIVLLLIGFAWLTMRRRQHSASRP